MCREENIADTALGRGEAVGGGGWLQAGDVGSQRVGTLGALSAEITAGLCSFHERLMVWLWGCRYGLEWDGLG